MHRPWILLNEAGVPAGGGAPAVTPAPPAVTPPPAAASAIVTDDQSPAWLPDRLKRAEEQARAKLLADLGVTDPEKAKAALAAAAKADEDAKSQGQKLGEATTRLTALEQENAELRGAVKLDAETKMAALTEEQRAAITELAGDDPHAQVLAIKTLAPTWKTPEAPKVDPKPKTPPASTTPAPKAPAAEVTSPPDRKAEYARLKRENPHAAAVYLNQYQSEIYPRA